MGANVRDLFCPSGSVVAKGTAARFENDEAPEIIGPDLTLSVCSQSFTEKFEASKADQSPIKYDRTR